MRWAERLTAKGLADRDVRALPLDATPDGDKRPSDVGAWLAVGDAAGPKP